MKGGRRLTLQACRLPRPQHAANESNGNGWAHAARGGFRDYSGGPRGAVEGDLRREGEETPAGSPAAEPRPCSRSAGVRRRFLLMMDMVGICV